MGESGPERPVASKAHGRSWGVDLVEKSVDAAPLRWALVAEEAKTEGQDLVARLPKLVA